VKSSLKIVSAGFDTDKIVYKINFSNCFDQARFDVRAHHDRESRLWNQVNFFLLARIYLMNYEVVADFRYIMEP